MIELTVGCGDECAIGFTDARGCRKYGVRSFRETKGKLRHRRAIGSVRYFATFGST